MSTGHPEDRRSFDDTVDRAWRSESSEQPPARVDAAILSEARKPRSRFSGWQPLAAAAAVGCLAFLLVQLMPRERSSVASAPPAAAAGSQRAPVSNESRAADEALAVQMSAEPPAEVAKETPRPSSVTAGAAAPARLESARSMPQPAGTAKTSPQEWAAKIASLHAAGDLEAAAAALREFRAAQPNADRYLPEELRAWAAAVR